jgi:DNA-binding IclR family transcriptional regulator
MREANISIIKNMFCDSRSTKGPLSMAPKAAAPKLPRRPRPKAPETRGNSTIVIGARLLGVVAQFDGPTTLTRIAAAADMSPSRAYRYLRGLVDSGLVEQDSVSGRYDLGPEVLRLGLAAISRIDPVRLAIAALPDLTDRTGLISTLAVWGTHGPTVIRCEHATLSTPIRIREGIVLPLLPTAAGNLFLTYEPAAVTAPLLERELHDWNAAHKGRDAMTPSRIDTLKADIRRRGITRAIGERKPLHANIAAPVFGRDGRLEVTITLIGVRGSYDTSYTGEAARILKGVARDLSRKLGADS